LIWEKGFYGIAFWIEVWRLALIYGMVVNVSRIFADPKRIRKFEQLNNLKISNRKLAKPTNIHQVVRKTFF
jgi:hypothetical protein